MTFILIYLYLFVEPSKSATTSEKSRKVRGPKKPLEGRYILSEFDESTDSGGPRILSQGMPHKKKSYAIR